MAIDPKILDDLAQKLAGVVPAGVSQVREDLQKNLRAVLQSVLGHLDLVTREEFDVQNKVLERTREKLETINLRLVDLEASLQKSGTRKKSKK